MEKVIEIDILSTEDLYERYSQKEVSGNLINYIVNKTIGIGDNTVLKLIINSNLKVDLENIMKDAFCLQYQNTVIEHKRLNLTQILYLVLGIIAFVISTFVTSEILREIILISSWVLIWDMVETEIFSEVNSRKKEKALKRLLSCEIVIKK